MVEIVLLERIEKLGQIGDVVTVRPGYARNYLLPQKKALRATKENIQLFETRKAQIIAENLKRKGEAESVSKKMEGLSVVIIRQAGESGQLYGSVSSRDIADAIKEAGFTISREQIQIDRPIKSLGIFKLRVVLHPEVILDVAVNVAKSEEEAKIQAEGTEGKKSKTKSEAYVDPGSMPQPSDDLSAAFAEITDK